MAIIRNPICTGFHADPEARFYEGKYWIYVTRSDTDYTKQMNLDAYSSTDLCAWDKHEAIIDMSGFPYIWRAVWAPTIIHKCGKYYLIFASNDIRRDGDIGGLEIAVSDSPSGPFHSLIGRPLIDRFINGAQPIDAHLFLDDDETVYLYYGGWGHCNVTRMNDEMNSIVPVKQGTPLFIEMTPDGYVEGPCMLKRNGVYHFMWSSGNWTDGTYHVEYASSTSLLGPFDHKNIILEAQYKIANGPGHNSYLKVNGEEDEWLVVYHRRVVGDGEPGHRVLCIDRMRFEQNYIQQIEMTNLWKL